MADNITVKNAAGADTVVRTTDNAGVHTPHHHVDSSVPVSGMLANSSLSPVFPGYLPIDVSASGDTAIASPSTGKRIRIIAMLLVAAGEVTVKIKSKDGVGAVDLSGPLQLIKASGFSLPKNEAGWAEALTDEDLLLNLSAAIQVGGMLVYVEE